VADVVTNLLGRLKRRVMSFTSPPPDLNFITDSLAVGAACADERQLRALADLDIGAVVDLRAEAVDDAELLGRLGIRFLHLPTADWRPMSQEDLDRGTDWVLDQLSDGRKTLIHCGHGIGRSVLLTAAVLVRMGYPWQEAMQVIQRKRPRAGPRDEQLAALAEFARRHRRSAT